MRRAGYRFLTTWVLDAPRELVFDAIHEVERWPEWWRGVESVEKLDGGADDGVGSVYRHAWRSILPYTVRFDMETTRIERPLVLEGQATGELEGVGRWAFAERNGGTVVTYEWNVRTTRPWMNLLAPIGRPVFAWSHNVVMGRGGVCLARRLDTRLVAAS